MFQRLDPYETLLIEVVSIRTKLELWIENPSGNGGIVNFLMIAGEIRLLNRLAEMLCTRDGHVPRGIGLQLQNCAELLVSSDNPMGWLFQKSDNPLAGKNFADVMSRAAKVSALQLLDRSLVKSTGR